MTRRHLPLRILSLALVAAAFACGTAHAGEFTFFDRIDEGWWQTELTDVFGNYQKKIDRDGDYYVTGKFEYEWPNHDRITTGIRVYPLFIYHQSDPSETIAGAGFGIANRIYLKPGAYDGWYGEIAANPIFHYPKIEGTSTSFNFLIEAGIGYRFPDKNWNIALKWHHISNAGFGSRNKGVNGAGLSVGYRF
ncbi:MAG: acyloxyacyl hydrolase [bacterium]|nr:acyloxyacyl hydrolase [bacterium]